MRTRTWMALGAVAAVASLVAATPGALPAGAGIDPDPQLQLVGRYATGLAGTSGGGEPPPVSPGRAPRWDWATGRDEV